MDSSFTDYEKRFVLAEMIKASTMDWKVLRDFLRAHEVQPDLLGMQLPPGRTMYQCIRAAETMEVQLSMPTTVSTVSKRKSVGDLNEPAPKRQAITSPFEPRPAPGPYGPSRSFGSMTPGSAPLPPQPAPFPMPAPPRAPQNGLNTAPLGSPQLAPVQSGPISTPTVLPTRRKRGRPSKADMEARARERSSRVTGYQPIKAAPVPIAPSPVYQIDSSQPPDQQGPSIGNLPAGDRLGQPDAIPRTMQGTPTLKLKPESGPSRAVGTGTKSSDRPSSAQATAPAPAPAPAPSPAPNQTQKSVYAPPADMGSPSGEQERDSKLAPAPAPNTEQGDTTRNESPVSIAS